MQYYLNYDQNGNILGCYADLTHGKEVPEYNAEPVVTKDVDGNEVTQEPGTVQTGTKLDLSAIPKPYIEITETEHNDWMQNQLSRRIDIDTKKLVEYTLPAPSTEVIKQNKLSALDAEYQPQFASLAQAIGLATLDGDQAVIDGIKIDYTTLKSEYQLKKEAIENGN